LYNIIYNIINK